MLSVLIFLPIISGVLIYLFKNEYQQLAEKIALLVSCLVLVLSLWIYLGFDTQNGLMQFEQRTAWIPTFNIEYFIGIDGISLALILLTALCTPLVILMAKQSIKTQRVKYYAAFLVMEGLVIGTFSALDSMLFYVFWEASLIPMLFIIGIWGQNRVYAAIKFFLYTFLGSVFMLLAFIYMYSLSGAFDVFSLYDLPLSQLEQIIIFWAFFVAFAVKVPMFPVHTWLPDAHVQAPTGGSVLLAAVMLKMGGYGFFRFLMPIVPDAAALFAETVVVLSLIAIVYIGIIALVQQDVKKLIAYSSISHMGFVTLGCFLIFIPVKFNPDVSLLALQGSMVQMISHGFISAAMFLIVGVLYDRMHTREISAYGGVANRLPAFTAFAVFFAMANSGLPGTSGFVGEFMIILAAVKVNFWFGFIAALTLVIGAAYTLWMIKRVFWGSIKNKEVAVLDLLSAREFFVLGVLAGIVLWIGVYPSALTQLMETSLLQLLQYISSSKL